MVEWDSSKTSSYFPNLVGDVVSLECHAAPMHSACRTKYQMLQTVRVDYYTKAPRYLMAWVGLGADRSYPSSQRTTLSVHYKLQERARHHGLGPLDCINLWVLALGIFWSVCWSMNGVKIFHWWLAANLRSISSVHQVRPWGKSYCAIARFHIR